ncbi:hypothetical protein KAJ27_25665 [bacterium]|nr:hypothetical protein [bacterium]
MRKIISFIFLFALIFSTGCILEENAQDIPVDSIVYSPISGIITIPESGLQSKAMPGANAYLVSNSVTQHDMLKGEFNYIEKVWTGSNGKYNFSKAESDKSYHVLIDINDDLQYEDVKLSISPGSNKGIALLSYVSSIMIWDDFISGLTLDSLDYTSRSEASIQIEGYTETPRSGKIEIWSVGTGYEQLLWRSHSFSLDGNFSQNIDFTPSEDWPNSANLPVTEYLAVLAVDDLPTSGCRFTISNSDATSLSSSDTPVTLQGKLVPSNFPTLFDSAWGDFIIRSSGTEIGTVTDGLFSIQVPAQVKDDISILIDHHYIDEQVVTFSAPFQPGKVRIAPDTTVTWKTGTLTVQVWTNVDQDGNDDSMTVTIEDGFGSGVINFIDTDPPFTTGGTDMMASITFVGVPIGERIIQTSGAATLEPPPSPPNYYDVQTSKYVREGAQTHSVFVGGR